MRLATWNVNGLRARLDFVLEWVAERRPDVLALQEIKLTEEQFPHEAFLAAGLHAVVHGQKAWNGVAVLARETPRATQRGLPGFEADGARLLTAEVGSVEFTSIYVPNGKSVDHPDFERKLAWLDALIHHVQGRREAARSAIVAGDFNVCPAPLDSWNEQGLQGRIFHTEAERARLARLLEGGLVDAFRAVHPDTQAFSWWDYRGGAFHRKQGLRIDLLLAARPVMDRVKQVEIDRDFRKKREGRTPSDHAPVWLELA